jgi:2-methylisocitrate lyase-like PEP mutase family enzyme
LKGVERLVHANERLVAPKNLAARVDTSVSAVSLLRQLHRPQHLLVLPNAWDAASAALFEELGAEAIATTSAGLAWANGYSDGSNLPRRVLLEGVASIARVTKLPLTIDCEGGYSEDPAQVADLIRALIDAVRVDGINIEDGLEPPELLVRKIHAIRRAAEDAGSDVFINARADVYLLELVAPERALRETLERAARYEAAGCDGIFVPGLSDPIAIAKIVQATELPVNVLASPNLPPLDELRRIGVRRLSVGSAIALRSYATARQLATSILKGETIADLYASKSMGYAELNDLMRSRERE